VWRSFSNPSFGLRCLHSARSPKRDSVTADLTLNIDVSDDLHGMHSYFALGKVYESFLVTFFFFLMNTDDI